VAVVVVVVVLLPVDGNSVVAGDVVGASVVVNVVVVVVVEPPGAVVIVVVTVVVMVVVVISTKEVCMSWTVNVLLAGRPGIVLRRDVTLLLSAAEFVPMPLLTAEAFGSPVFKPIVDVAMMEPAARVTFTC